MGLILSGVLRLLAVIVGATIVVTILALLLIVIVRLVVASVIRAVLGSLVAQDSSRLAWSLRHKALILV